jgi:phosphatidylglycerophosphatase A
MVKNMFSKLKAINIFKKNLSRDYKVPPIPDSIWKNPWHFIAFGFGTGAIPIAPGTFGTLIAIPIYLYLESYSNTFYFIFLILFTFFSIWLCEKVSDEIKVDDHQGMNIDEIVGFLVTMFWAPYGWKWILLGFILFRVFDILKPWPIRQIDARMKGGVGMILDDVLAGVYSFLIIQVIAWIVYD